MNNKNNKAEPSAFVQACIGKTFRNVPLIRGHEGHECACLCVWSVVHGCVCVCVRA